MPLLLCSVVVHCGSLELDLLMASIGATVDHVSGICAEGVLAILEQAASVGGDDSGEEVEG
jgi:fibrillarin-like rRNA methylase